MADVFLLIAGLVAIATALTGGRFGVFRPDLSLRGAADLLGVIATVLLAWLVIFDFPDGAGREVGVFLALLGAMAVAGGAGDYATLHGAPLFPKRLRRPVRARRKETSACLPEAVTLVRRSRLAQRTRSERLTDVSR